MELIIPGWTAFCIAMGVLMFAAIFMQWSGAFFLTFDVVVRNFTILDLELAATETEINNIIGGISRLPGPAAKVVLRALRNHLYADFLFMPAAYGALFIGCMKVAHKMPLSGEVFFTFLAWAQAGAWLADILENCYLLQKISHAGGLSAPHLFSFRLYQRLEVVKWSLSMLALVCVLSALMYYWISGLYMGSSLRWLLVLVLELCAFVVLMQMARRPGKRWKENVHA